MCYAPEDLDIRVFTPERIRSRIAKLAAEEGRTVEDVNRTTRCYVDQIMSGKACPHSPPHEDIRHIQGGAR